MIRTYTLDYGPVAKDGSVAVVIKSHVTDGKYLFVCSKESADAAIAELGKRRSKTPESAVCDEGFTIEGGIPFHVSESGKKTRLEWADDRKDMSGSTLNYRHIVKGVMKCPERADGGTAGESIIVGFETVKDVEKTLATMKKKGWAWRGGYPVDLDEPDAGWKKYFEYYRDKAGGFFLENKNGFWWGSVNESRPGIKRVHFSKAK